MSGLLAGKVWQSALAPHLKPLAAALADIGNDDGTSIYPSVSYVSWLLGRSERSVQYGLDELRSLGVLVVEKNGRGGRHSTTEYRMVEEKLPTRRPWREGRKGATVSPFQIENGATPAPIHSQNGATLASIEDRKGATRDTKGCNLRQERVKLVAPEPSLTVLTEENSKTNTAPNDGASFELPGWIPLSAWNAFLEMRKKLRKPLTPYGVRLAVKKLEDLRAAGNEPKAVLDNSTLNNYQGLFAPRVDERDARAAKIRTDATVGKFDPARVREQTPEEKAEFERMRIENERWEALEKGILAVTRENVVWVKEKQQRLARVPNMPKQDRRPQWFRAFLERATAAGVAA